MVRVGRSGNAAASVRTLAQRAIKAADNDTTIVGGKITQGVADRLLKKKTLRRTLSTLARVKVVVAHERQQRLGQGRGRRRCTGNTGYRLRRRSNSSTS
jgi:hypothetical protein